MSALLDQLGGLVKTVELSSTAEHLLYTEAQGTIATARSDLAPAITEALNRYDRLQEQLESRIKQVDEQYAELKKLRAAFQALESEFWTLECIDIRTPGRADADVGLAMWRIVSHHMDQPAKRQAGIGVSPLEAIRDAIANKAAAS